MVTVASITNGIINLSVDTTMRVDNFVLDSFSLWGKTDDTINYKDLPSGVIKSFSLKNIVWTISSQTTGIDHVITGIGTFIDISGVSFTITYKYKLTDGVNYATVTVDTICSEELHFIRASHLGRSTVNNLDRKPRYIFKKDKEIDYLDYSTSAALQAIWTGTVTPTRTVDNMSGDSTSAMQIILSAGTHTISKTFPAEDWTDSDTLFCGINAKTLTGVNHSVRLFWISNSITYFTRSRKIDEGEPFNSNWTVFHLRHFYLNILPGIDRTSITSFGLEIITDGATLIIDEIWRFTKQDILSAFAVNNVDFYDVLPFFNSNVPWDRRMSEETFITAYADETALAGTINGISWIGEWRSTSDIVISELTSIGNSNPLSIGGQIKHTPVGLTMKNWSAKWHILPHPVGTSSATMFSNAETLYNSLLNDTNFTTPSKAGIGQTSAQPYIWNGLEDPINILIPKLRRYADAGVTDLIIPMGNSGWGSWKSRVWRYDIANTLKEKGDDRLNFILNSWIDPNFPERRVFLESTIFDNHWMRDETDEQTIFSDVTKSEGRIFVYQAADARELYIKRSFSPINPTWFNNQTVDGVVYVFSYQYPIFRPSLGHISRTGSTFGKTINLHDRWLDRINDVAKAYNISGLVISEWFWYKRGFDSNSLTLYNQYRTSKSLPTLTDFDRQNNNLPAAIGTNEYITDNQTLWDWKNTETANIISDVKALLSARNLKLWISGNVDNIISVKDPLATVWNNVDMLNGNIPTGDNAFLHDNTRHSTKFENLNANPNLNVIWSWNYWGFSEIYAITDFINHYKNHKSKISMALGVFPRSSPPSATSFLEAIIQSRIAGFRISFVGDRNYTESHFVAMETGMLTETIHRRIAEMISNTPATLIKINIDQVIGSTQVASTYLFSEKEKPLHLQNPTTALPYLDKDIHLGQEIKENVTLSGRITIVFHDDFNSDGSSFWKKWVAANPFSKNRIIEILKGFSGQPESLYSVFFKGVIDNIIFKTDSKVEIIVKNLLTITNQDFPSATDGKLLSLGANIILQENTGLNPFASSGHQYNSSGHVKIDNEILSYASVTDISAGNKTQFQLNTVVRGLLITDGFTGAVTHDTGSNVQQVEIQQGNALNVMQSLMLQAGIQATDINTQSFTDTINDWLPDALVRGILHEPGSIKEYLKELREVTFTSLFQDENQKITVSFLTPGVIGQTFKKVGDSNEIILKSVFIDKKQDSRITRISFEYDEQPDGKFKNKTTFIDLQIESDYKEQRSKTFKSRWLKTDINGATTAQQTAQNIIRVFGDGKSIIQFDLETKDDNLKVGDLFKLSTSSIQTELGQPISEVLFQVTKKSQVAANRWKYKAFDTRLKKRFGFYSSDTIPDYTFATETERIHAFYSDDLDQMSNGDGGYFYF